MVLPTPAAPDAHAPAELTKRLSLILRLADAGILVLIELEKPEQLGRLVRAVLSIEPDFDLFTGARALLNADPGQCILFVPDVGEATWLNQERPILAQRRLRVLMTCSKQEAAEIAHGAPDFFHWISHWMEAPRGSWAPVIRGLREASNREEPIAWEGGDFEATFVEVFGEIKRISLSAAQPYPELVESFRTQTQWLVVTDVDGPFRRRRICWAMAESSRKGKLVVLDPKGSLDGFARVTSVPMPLKEAEKRLCEAGAKLAAKLATILDCEVEAIELAAQLLAKGIAEDDCLAVWKEEDPGVALVRLAEQRGIEVPKDAPCVQRANGAGARLEIGDWGAAANDALNAGDAEVAAHFARRGLAVEQDRIDIAMTLGIALTHSYELQEALSVLRGALEQVRNAPNPRLAEQLLLLALLSAAYRKQGEYTFARKHIELALKLVKKIQSEEQHHVRGSLLAEHAIVLFGQNDLEGGKRSALAALKEAGDDPSHAANALEALGQFYVWEENYDEGRKSLLNALDILERLHGKDHPAVVSCLLQLGGLEIDDDHYEATVHYVDRAIRIQREVNDPRIAVSLDMLGAALHALGDSKGAEKHLLEARELMERRPNDFSALEYAGVLSDLGGVRFALGQLKEARPLFEEALRAIKASSTKNSTNVKNLEILNINYGHLLVEMGEYALGHAVLEKAYRSLVKKLGPEHKLTRDAAQLLSRIPPETP